MSIQENTRKKYLIKRILTVIDRFVFNISSSYRLFHRLCINHEELFTNTYINET